MPGTFVNRLPAGYVLTIVANAASSGLYRRREDSGATRVYDAVAIAASTTTLVGPFTTDRQYVIINLAGDLSYSIAQADLGTSGTGDTLRSTSPSAITPVITGNGGSGFTVAKTALFTEDATSLTHTATITIPAGATLIDIIVVPQVLWTGGTAAFTCGDANAATGWFTSADLKATDLILGERLQASNANNWGGVNGAYLTTAGRFGQQSTTMIGGYCPTAYSVIGVVTVGTPATTAGRTRMTVLYLTGESVAPVLA